MGIITKIKQMVAIKYYPWRIKKEQRSVEKGYIVEESHG